MSAIAAFVRSPALRRLGQVVTAATLVYLAAVPLLPQTNDATLFTYTLMLTTIGVAINWNLTGGFTGYVDFGHAVWFGIGAYVTAIFMSTEGNSLQIGWPPVLCILLGAVVSGVLAALIGSATMRLKGPYFSIAMLGTFVAMREIVRVAKPVTGGGVGLNLPLYLNRPLFYYVQLVLVAALLVFTWWLRRTRFGSALVAIREDEVGAEMRGINATRTKVAIFSFAGMSTGLFGGLWAFQITSVDPDTAFVELRTVEAVMGAMLGGIGTVIGPVIGATVLFWLNEVVWANFLDFHLIVQGVLLIVIVLYIPRGLVGLFDARGPSVITLLDKWLGTEPSDTYGDDRVPVRAGLGSAESGEWFEDEVESDPVLTGGGTEPGSDSERATV
ncbi:MAG: branched-chain amino acid ABC transporter permease [Actinomycetota bacterium]